MEKNGKGIAIAGIILVIGIAVIITWTAAVKAIAGTNGGNGGVKEEVINAPVERIVVTEVSHDVLLKTAADGKVKVVYTDTDNIVHRIDVSGNTLSVTAKQKKGGWMKRLFGGLFSFSFKPEEKKQTIIYLPEGSYESLSVGTVSGDVEIPEAPEFSELEAATVSGEINLTDADITGKVTLETVSGDVSGNVQGSHSYDVHSLSGDKTFPEGTAGAPEVSVSTTSGDVELS